MNYLGLKIHPPQQVVEARVVAEGIRGHGVRVRAPLSRFTGSCRAKTRVMKLLGSERWRYGGQVNEIGVASEC